jgi:abhydrolase domain-containing protein 13
MVCFGRSLGGAVAISLAARYPNIVRAVVVENTFLSIPAMVDQLMPVVSSLKGLILNIKWDSDVKIKELQQPILFISGLSSDYS